MAETRIKLGKQLEKSAVPYSILVTDSASKQKYTAPGAEDTVLTIVGGVPTFQLPATQSFTITDGTTSQEVQNGDTLTITSGDGIEATISATDMLEIAAKISGDAGNSLTFGSDGGLYTEVQTVFTGATWDDSTNSLVFTFSEGPDVTVPVTDAVGDFLADFTISDGTNTHLINNHETITFAGSGGVDVTVNNNTVEISSGQLTEVFDSLSTGNSVTTAQTVDSLVYVTRNGLMQHSPHDFTITSNTLSFVDSFGPSVGGVGSETVIVAYNKA